MTTDEGRSRITPRSRRAAARLRIKLDRLLGERTPDWIVALAEQSDDARSQS